MSRSSTSVVALAAALLALAAGLWLGGHPRWLPGGIRDSFVEQDRSVRAEVIEMIEDDFFKKTNRERLEQASLKGIVRSLGDRYSHYYTPEETRLFNQAVQGEFEGVGMSVEEDKRGLRILKVFAGSPAAKAGIRKGDLVTAVDGDSIAGESAELATAKIKGKAGTSVRLAVISSANARKRTISVRRARIEVPAAEGRVTTVRGVKMGVVELHGFTSGAHGKLREVIGGLRRRGARGLVLDLRGNGGGLLREAVLVSSLFVEDGLIVSTSGRSSARREYKAEGDAIKPPLPVVVLVDGGSASASEIVAGALRDRGRATLVGVRTFGKGVFQSVAPLSNGGALDLTIGSYFLPDGENISNKGITPKIQARDVARTKRDEALPVALTTLMERVSGGGG